MWQFVQFDEETQVEHPVKHGVHESFPVFPDKKWSGEQVKQLVEELQTKQACIIVQDWHKFVIFLK